MPYYFMAQMDTTMIDSIINIVNGEPFSVFSTLFSFLGDAAILVLTIYTLHITAFSKKLAILSLSLKYNTFYGNGLSFTVVNKTLHAIPVQKVFILKYYEGNFIYMNIQNYEEPIAIDSWSAKKIEMEPFTSIKGWSISDPDGGSNYDELFHLAIVGIVSGSKVIWLKSTDNGLKRWQVLKGKRAYKHHDYDVITMYRRKVDDHVLAEPVDCLISVKLKDINGQIFLQTALGISTFSGGDDLLLSEHVLGYNLFSGAGHNADEIKRSISTAIGIKQDDVIVRMLK